VCTTGLSLLAIGCLRGVTPWGQLWPSAVPLPQGRHGLRARQMAVWSPFRAPRCVATCTTHYGAAQCSM